MLRIGRLSRPVLSRTFFVDSSSSSSSSSQPSRRGGRDGNTLKRLVENGEYSTVIERVESQREPVSESAAKAYLAALSFSGDIWRINLSRFIATLMGPASSSNTRSSNHSSSTGGSNFQQQFQQFQQGQGREPEPLPVTLVRSKERKRMDMLGAVARFAVFGGILYYIFTQNKVGGAGGTSFNPFNMKPTHKRAEDVTVTFDDVKGSDEALNELMEIVEYLRDPRKFTRLGAKLPRGVLLSGPPGTGKTLLARAVAGEAGVPFFYTSGSGFDEMFVGVGPRRVRELFEEAKANAPCIVFIDEIDAVGGKRSALNMSRQKESLNALLTEMDGFTHTEGVIVLAATNLPGSLDSALTRPGRFDRKVDVPAPHMRGRTQILDLYLKKTKVSADVNSTTLARGTPGFTGADLASMVNTAAIKASMRGMAEITQALLEEAKDDVLMGVVRKSAAAHMKEEELLMTAYHEVGHALVAHYTPGAMPLHKATILPRGNSLGATFQLPEDDQNSVSKKQCFARLAVALGGRAAEELQYGSDGVTTGASSDFQNATNLAVNMITRWGMSDKVGFVYHQDPEKTDPATKKEVKELLDERYQYALTLLKKHETQVHRVAAALLEREELNGAQIRALCDGEALDPLPAALGEFNGTSAL